MNPCDWNLNWGTVPDWVAGLGTVLTLLFGVLVYQRDAENRRRAQPRLVYAVAGNGHQIGPDRLGPTHTFQITDGYRMALVNPGIAERLPRNFASANQVCNFVPVRVANNSEEVVIDVRLRLLDFRGDQVGNEIVAEDYIQPTAEVLLQIGYVDDRGPNGVTPQIDFTDAVGQRWRAHIGEPLKPIPPLGKMG